MSTGDLIIGLAGEHLVCADLLVKGYRAFLTVQACPYDIAVETNRRLIRLQVKTTRHPKPIMQRKIKYPVYQWTIKHHDGSIDQVDKWRRCSLDDFDMIALVALDSKQIAYFAYPEMRGTIQIRPAKTNGDPRGRYFDMYPFEKALEEVIKEVPPF